MIYRLGVMGSFAAIAYLGFALLTELQSGFLQPPLSPAQWCVLGLCIVLSTHFVLLIHELGHIVGGWLAGYDFHEVIVGALRVERRDNRFCVRFNPDLRHYGGHVRMVPGRSSESRSRTALMLMFGPVASVAVGVLVTLIGLTWLSEATIARAGFPGYLIAEQIVVIGVGSIVVGLANLVPVSFRGRQSDGAKIWLRLASE